MKTISLAYLSLGLLACSPAVPPRTVVLVVVDDTMTASTGAALEAFDLTLVRVKDRDR